MRRSALAAGGLLAVLAVLLAAAWAGANSGPGRAWLTARLEAAASQPGVRRVEIAALEGALPQRVVLRGLRLHDPAGVWLMADRVELAWRPLALLAGRLHVERLTAGQVALARPPQAPAPAEPAGAPSLALPRPPLPLRLDRLHVEAVRLAAPVLGRPAAFSIDGEAAAPAEGALRTRLAVERIDAAPGRLTLRAALQPAARTLELEARLEEPAGGLLARALELPGLPPVSVSLAGDGPLDDWRGRLEVRLGEGVRLDAEVTLAGAAPTLGLDGTAEVAGLLDAASARLLGGPLELHARLRRAGAEAVAVERLSLASPTLAVEAGGRVDAEAGTMDLDASLEVHDPAPLNARLAPASLAGATLSLSARGPLMRPNLHAEASLARLAAPEATLHGVTLAADLAPEDGLHAAALAAEGAVARLETTLPEARGFAGAALDWRLEGRLAGGGQRLEGARLHLALADAAVELSGGLDLAAGRGDAAVHLALADLARLDPLLGLGLEGRGELDGYLSLSPGDPVLEGTVAGELDDVRVTGEDITDALLRGRVALASDLALAADGALRLERIALSGPRASARGDLAFPADFATIDGDLDLRLPEAAVLSAPLGVDLAGRARAEARLSGPVDDPGLDGRLTVARAALEGLGLGTVTADVTAERLASGVEGRVRMTTGGPAGPLEAAADFALAGTVFHLREGRARGAGVAVERARLAVPLAGGPLAGEARARIDDLGALAALAGLQAGGRGTLQVAARGGADGGQSVEVEAELEDLRLPLDGGGALAVAGARLTADGDDLLARPRGRLKLAAREAAFGPATLARLDVTAEGAAGGADLTLAAAGDVLGPTDLQVEARLAADGAGARLELARLEGRLAGRRLALERPARLARGPEGLSVEDLAVALEDGRLGLDATLGERVEATLTAEALPLSLARAVLAEPTLSGRLDGRLRLTGPAAAPEGELRLELRQVAAREAKDVPPLDLILDGRLSDGRLALDGRLEGVAERPVAMRGELPLAVSLAPFELAVERRAPIAGRLAWQGEVAPLMPLVPASGHRLTGRAELELAAAGSLAAPELHGHLALADGVYENLTTGTLLRELDVRVDADGRRLTLTRLTAKAGGKGGIEGSGTVRLAPEAGFPVDVSLRAEEARLVRRDEADARISGRIELQGTLAEALLAGRLEVRRAELRIPDELPPEVVELEVVEVGGPAAARSDAEATGARSPETTAPAAGGELALDLTVAMPGRVFLRGKGLDTEWAGELRIRGTAARPVIEGGLNSVRGEISFLGKTFRLQRGEVAFTGGRDIDPELLAVAKHASGDLQVTVEVSGSVSQPRIALSSVPELPQDEIIARVLFDKSASELTGLEAVQLAAAVAELSGRGTPGGGILETVRELAGVDVLRVGSGEETGPTVTAGKYLTDEVFVGVEQGVTPESSAVTMEVEVTENIVVESDLGRTGSSNIGVKFKWDY